MSATAQQQTQEVVIAALVAGQTATEAAAAAGVSARTVYRYMRDAQFRAQLAAGRAAQWAPVARRLRAGVGRALDLIEQLMNSTQTHESTRLRAAVAYIEMAVQLKKVTDTDERLASLEDLAAERTSTDPDASTEL
jgi:hypothetical protein